MKKLLSIFAAVIASAAIAWGASIPLLTGPQPAADLVSIINTLIQSINGQSGQLPGTVQTTAVALPSATNIEQTLMTYSLPGNTLSSAGNALRVTCWGYASPESTSATKTIKLYFGGTTVTTPALAVTPAQGFNWSLSYIVMRRSATTQAFDGTGQVGATITASVITLPLPTVADAAETLSGAITIKCTGTNNNAVPQAGGIVAQGMLTEVIK